MCPQYTDAPLPLSFSMFSGPWNWGQNSNLALKLERVYHNTATIWFSEGAMEFFLDKLYFSFGNQLFFWRQVEKKFSFIFTITYSGNWEINWAPTIQDFLISGNWILLVTSVDLDENSLGWFYTKYPYRLWKTKQINLVMPLQLPNKTMKLILNAIWPNQLSYIKFITQYISQKFVFFNHRKFKDLKTYYTLNLIKKKKPQAEESFSLCTYITRPKEISLIMLTLWH